MPFAGIYLGKFFMTSHLRISRLSHSYGGALVVNNVSMDCEAGELVCLLGPSGCGKTTLLRVAAGLEKIQAGQVHIGEFLVDDAVSGKHISPDKRGIGLMFQDYALFPHLTVRENIWFGAGADSTLEQQWIESALQNMGLLSHAHQYPHTLSGGQQQRVALLRALAPKPQVLFLDEPFSGLDIVRRSEVRSQTLEIVRAAGVATLMVTHDPEEAMFMADRIFVMNQGCIIQEGTPRETYFAPNSEFVANLFGKSNRLIGKVKNGKLETLVGSFNAENIDSGELAHVLIRPEAFHLTHADENMVYYSPDDSWESEVSTPNPADKKFIITAAHQLGRSSLVSFKAQSASKSEAILEARVPSTFTPKIGEHVTLKVNTKQAFVFPV